MFKLEMFKLESAAFREFVHGSYDACLAPVRKSVGWPLHVEIHAQLRAPLLDDVSYRHRDTSWQLPEAIFRPKGANGDV